MDLFQEEAGLNLRDYQEEAVENIIKVRDQGLNPLVIMATGTGKTIVAADVIKRLYDRDGKPSLFVAHRDELIRQARAKIKSHTGLDPQIEKAQEVAGKKSKMVIASVQTLQKKRLEKWNPGYFDLLTVDEAHHACAKTYKNVIDYFNANTLGITATPDRADQKELGEIFDAIAYEYPLHRAISDGWLSRIVGKRVKDFDIDLNDLRIIAGDFTDSDLGNKIGEYLTPIVNSIKKETTGRRTLIFMPNVRSSELISIALNEVGIKADFISGGLKVNSRREVLNKFSSGVITHLASCDILLEGYDEPSIDAIVMLRPTSSRTVYAQSIGRGTRLFPGKENLLLIEYTFNSQNLKLVTPYELFATAGYDERVRNKAQSTAGDYVDFFEHLSMTKENFYSVSSVIDRSITKEYGFSQFDPVGIGDIAGVDMSGEFDIKYKGRKLEGPITAKQRELLERYNITNIEALDKAQASKLISSIFEKGWLPLRGAASGAQRAFLESRGIDTLGMTKAQASILIDTIKKG